MIERKDGTRCGLVRLYDFDVESFTWGSWILDESKPRKAALESAVLSLAIGFELFQRDLAKVQCAGGQYRCHSILSPPWYDRNAIRMRGHLF